MHPLLLNCRKNTTYSVQKGTKFTTEIVQETTDITHDLLLRYSTLSDSCSNEWKTATFKKYNFNALGMPPQGGHLHPLLKVREEFRQIFFELGCV